MTSTAFVLKPISAQVADELRLGGGPVYIADEHPGYPCRQCVRDAEIGDQLVLVSYDPFVTDSKYRSASPIFLHVDPCEPDSTMTGLPDQLTRRQLSVRSFDPDEMMIDAAVIDGTELGETIERFFENSLTQFIHVHNATRGCWAVGVERDDPGR